ncbi:hypothetical protein HK107_00875 [Parvularcula sp. ZS-1/3]|uniref:Lipoprotein n=1 Tax=Parvularcula mediterranea TaxID=2732508 RepID=A0A7Y3W3W4_9PROT|nr:hypothetical protein [Parvularcula mediterranea]NNU14874.1 hypothetical protein [Parvularcula mediterranea]
MRITALGIFALMLAACGSENATLAERETYEAMEEAMAQEDLGPDNGRTPVEIKTATCLLWPSNFRGDCSFEPRGRGSFMVRLEDGQTFYDDVFEVFVSVFKEGHADVRVINKDGSSEMLGEAKRSETYPACWIGTGFSVCAY